MSEGRRIRPIWILIPVVLLVILYGKKALRVRDAVVDDVKEEVLREVEESRTDFASEGPTPDPAPLDGPPPAAGEADESAVVDDSIKESHSDDGLQPSGISPDPEAEAGTLAAGGRPGAAHGPAAPDTVVIIREPEIPTALLSRLDTLVWRIGWLVERQRSLEAELAAARVRDEAARARALQRARDSVAVRLSQARTDSAAAHPADAMLDAVEGGMSPRDAIRQIE